MNELEREPLLLLLLLLLLHKCRGKCEGDEDDACLVEDALERLVPV